MGSLKRKNASLPASATSSKRASREDSSSNGYAGRRSGGGGGGGGGGHSSSSSSGAGTSATPDPLSNGNTPPSKFFDDPLPSSDSPDKQTLETVKISDMDSLSPADAEKNHEDEETCPSESSNPKNSGPLIPNHAGWFSWSSIHPLEQRGLPDFFNSKSKFKTPTLYMEYRNLLMKKYLENPEKLFTIADVPSTIPDNKEGHIEAAKRIFAFLDHWGLLNSRALGRSETDKPTEPKTSVAEEKPSVTEEKPSITEETNSVVEEKTHEQLQTTLASSLYRFDSPSVASSSRRSTKISVVMPTSAITESTVADLQGGLQGTPVEYHCNSCSADCSKRRFHCQKQADFDLCPECYNDGKFSYGITSTDFILMEAVTDANDSSGWSDQETLLLLEALELYGDNFSEIAEHVGTKTKAQCILHFIRLPIEDPFLDAMESNNISNVQQSTDSGIGNKNSSSQAEEQDLPNETVRQKALEDNIPVSGNAIPRESFGDDHLEDKASNTMNALLSAAQAAGLVGPDKSIAFSECGNPVMALVSFLAALVSPDAAAVSAQNALKILAEKASALQLADQNSFNLELEPSSNDESMIVEEREFAEGAEPSDSQSAMESALDEGGEKINDTSDIGGDKMKDTPDECGDKMKDTPDVCGDKMEDTPDICDDKVKDTSNISGDKTKDTSDTSGDKMKDASNTGGDKTTSVDQGNIQSDNAVNLFKCSSVDKVKNAATTALAAAALKAKFLADQEEWEILRYTAVVVDTQAKKIETKLKLFRDLDMALEKENTMLERSKQRLLTERSQIAASRTSIVVPPSQYMSPISSVFSGPRMPHQMSRLSSGFAPVPPVPTGPFIAYGQSESFRGFTMPHVNDVQGVNMMPMRPMQFNNAPQF